MLSCWGNIVCDICFRFSSVALLSWLVGQIMMLPYHYRHNWQLVPPVFVLNGIFWNAWMLEKKWKQKHCLDTMGQNMMLKGLTVRVAFFRRPFLNVANSKINRPFVFFYNPFTVILGMVQSLGLPYFAILLVNVVKNNAIWLFNIAMENGPFIDVLPIINGDFPCLC